MQLKKVLNLLFVLISFGSFGQILDDSTQLVYGTKTVDFFYQEELLNNVDTTYFLDTLLNGFEKSSVVERSNNFYQDLGNFGTATNPIFYPLPQQIGRTSGFHSFDAYMPTADKQKLFDTKSPLIDLFAVIGAHGRQKVEIEYTQNVNENWNIGAGFNRISADKQVGPDRSEGDRNSINTSFDFHSYYEHPTVPYKLFGYLSLMNMDVDEIGGIYAIDSAERRDLFQYRNAVILLNDAFTSERRLNFHLYHEYDLANSFQIYHMFDRNTQTIGYQDFRDNQQNSAEFNTYTDFYDNFFIDNDSTYESTNFSELQNEAGLKGKLGTIFYRAYVKNRILNQNYLYWEDAFERVSENYLGGTTYFQWKDKFKVSGFAEYLVGGEFTFGGSIESKLLQASYRSVRYNQSFLAQRSFNNHFEWSNNFDPGFSNEIKGQLNLNYWQLNITPRVNITTHDQFVYFDEDALPRQTDGGAVISRLGTGFDFYLFTNRSKEEAFHFENEGYYTRVEGSSADVFRMPEWFYNGRIYWAGKWFEDALPTQVGFNIHAQSSYFVNAYNPVFQQFHIQNEFREKSYVFIDLFLNMQIDKVYVYAKMKHINQPGDDGYFVTYLYPGQERVFELGVRWLFFD